MRSWLLRATVRSLRAPMMIDRHAQRARQHRGHCVAKIAGRHHQVEPAAMRRIVGQCRVCVVAHLRQQAAETDAVGRTQWRLRLQLAVGQRLLDHRLAVVERTRDTQCLDVVAEAAELVRLARGYAAIRIQHHHAHAGLAMEGRSHRRTGIARGGNDDRSGIYIQKKRKINGNIGNR